MHRYLAEPDSGVFLHGAILVNKKITNCAQV